MNEIVHGSLEKDCGVEDEDSIVPETPQKEESPNKYQVIPIPNLTRIRMSLGVLDDNTNTISPKRTVLQSKENTSFTGYSISPKLSRYAGIKKNKFSSLQRVKICLFRDKPKKTEETKSFSVNPKSFYGTTNNTQNNSFILAESKSVLKEMFRKKNNNLKSTKKHEQGGINRGVKHGIKKPKGKRSSLKNDSMESDNQDENIPNKRTKSEQKVSEEIKCKEKNDDMEIVVEKYNPKNKFFKHKKFTLNLKQEVVDSVTLCKETLKNIFTHPVSPETIISTEQKGTSFKKLDDPYFSTNTQQGSKSFENQNDISDIAICNIKTESEEQSTKCEGNTFARQDTSALKGISHSFDDAIITKITEKINKNEINNTQPAINNSIKDRSDNFSIVTLRKSKKYGSSEQKLFITQCSECNLAYCLNDDIDEDEHLKYHNSFKNLQFQGWENEKIIYEDSNEATRIILIEPNDFNMNQKQLIDVLEIVTQDLDLDDTEKSNYNDKKIYLYIKQKTILGVLIAEDLNSAFKAIPKLVDLNYCTSESYPAKCGINILWTAKSYRKQGIATKLVDTLRSTYCCGNAMSVDDIAFSTPTSSGKSFAKNYTKTNSFKVY